MGGRRWKSWAITHSLLDCDPTGHQRRLNLGGAIKRAGLPAVLLPEDASKDLEPGGPKKRPPKKACGTQCNEQTFGSVDTVYSPTRAGVPGDRGVMLTLDADADDGDTV